MPSCFASDRPTEGSSCIKPYAFAYEIADGLNSDSCRISEATKYGSSPFFADSVLMVSHHGSGKRIRQYASGIELIGADVAYGSARFRAFIARYVSPNEA